MQVTSIEWTRGDDGTPGMTANPIRARNMATGKLGHHCVKISPGCANCYSGVWNGWRGNGLPFTKAGGEQAEMFLDEKVLKKLLKHRKPCRVFLGDMTDIFGEWVPDEWLDRIFATIARTPHITYQLLTKRPERMAAYAVDPATPERIARLLDGAADDGLALPIAWPLPNAWKGTSVENQATADERIPHLLKTPAAVRFLSCEPLLSAVDSTPYLGGRTYRCGCGFHRTENELVFTGGDHYSCPICNGRCEVLPAIDWVIAGGESGHGARPMHIDWVRSIVRQCKEASIPVFVKQIGADPRFNEADIWAGAADKRYDKKGGDWSLWPSDICVREFPKPLVGAAS